MRKKLIELLHSGVRCPGTVTNCGDCQYRSDKIPCDEYGATADMLIANGVTIQKWIPASKPPKDNEDYLVIYKTSAGNFYATGYWDGKCWRSTRTAFELPVLGWMTLPEPPKDERPKITERTMYAIARMGRASHGEIDFDYGAEDDNG